MERPSHDAYLMNNAMRKEASSFQSHLGTT
jgi:hypothetical protein